MEKPPHMFGASAEAEWRAGMVEWVQQYKEAIVLVHRHVHTAKVCAQQDVARSSQLAFVPMGGVALQNTAQALRNPPTAVCSAWLAAWRSSDEDRSAAGTPGDEKDAIESYADSFFTLFTFDNHTYRACSDGAPTVPWLTALPSLVLTHAAAVHRGPVSGGHVKLYFKAGESGALFSIDFTKSAGKVQNQDWGAATLLSGADYAYPRSGSMYPTIYRFLQVDAAKMPTAASSSTEARPGGEPLRRASARMPLPQIPAVCSGWVPLQDVTVSTAYSAFVDLASRRWANVELYNCRSFVSEMLLELTADPESVHDAFEEAFCAVAQIDSASRACTGRPWTNAWLR